MNSDQNNPSGNSNSNAGQGGQAQQGMGQQGQQGSGASGLGGQQNQSAAQQGQQGASSGTSGQQQQFDSSGGGQQGGSSGTSQYAGQIQPHMTVTDSEGTQCGTVDHLDGDQIKLARDQSGEHRYVPLSLVEKVENNQVVLRERGDNAFGMSGE